MLNNVISMFLLNSIWETYSIILFLKRDQNISFKPIQLYHLLFFIAFVNAFLYKIIPPFIFQIVYILFIILTFRYVSKLPIISCMKSIFKVISFIAIFESIITIIILQLGIDLRDMAYSTKQLLYCLPIKIIEIIIIYYFKQDRKENINENFYWNSKKKEVKL